MTITVDLATGTYGGQTVTLWPGETLVINGKNPDGSPSSVTFVGHSPALTVNSGNVVANGITFTNATDAATIKVSGGTLTLTQSTISYTGVYNDPAIQVTAGTLNLGTAPSPGGNTINVVGSGALVQAAPSATVSAVGDSFQVNGTPVASSSLSLTTLSSSVSPSMLNQAITFTTAVRPASGATTTPTGSVDFYDTTTGIDLGTVSLVNGAATLTTSALGAGSHVIRARYTGDSNFTFSLDTLNQAVQYKFSGFLAPLNTGVSYALGRAIPIKFQLTNYTGAAITSLVAVSSLLVAPVKSDGSLGTPLVPVSSDGKNLTYSGGQYLFNWKTTGLSAGSYQIQLNLADGTTQTKTIQLKAGGGAAGLLADTAGTSTAATAGVLLGGDLTIAVNDPNGLLTADEQARISDAISLIDLTVAPYGVTITQIDPSSGPADVTIDTSSTSAVGGYADGVLGCESGTEVTLIQGWNWYAGADPTAIQAGQFDFETVVMHELGHVLGLGHSADPTSVMYATLAAGTANRNLTTADLNVPDSDGGGPAGLHARVLRPAPPPAASRAMASPSLNQNVGLMAWDLAVADLSLAGLTRTQRKRT
jgi:hypothetical protein